MSCTRCQGLMLKECMIDMEADYGEMWSHSWRCFNCGHRDDAVINHHREVQARSMTACPQPVAVSQPAELQWESESVEPLAA